MKISRSYSRKINLGNYETTDFFSSRDIELPEDASDQTQMMESSRLFLMAVADVESSISDYFKIKEGMGLSKFADIAVEYCNTNTINIVDGQELSKNPDYNRIIQAIKRKDARDNKKERRPGGTHEEFKNTARNHFKKVD